MKTLSVYLIVKNEKSVIKRCIDSIISFSDEIIITDTGSTDKTKEIIKSINSDKIKLYDFEWCDNFSKARNFSLSNTTCDYVLTVDADEVADEELQNEILRLKENDFDGFKKILIPGFFLSNNSDESNFTRFIISKELEPYWIYPVHEVLKFKNDCGGVRISCGRILNNKFGDNIKTNFDRYCDMYYNEFNSNIKYETDGMFYYYIQYTIFTNDVPLVKKMLSNVYKKDVVKNGNDFRNICRIEGRFSKDEHTALRLINDENILNDEYLINVLYEMASYNDTDEFARYFIYRFFYENKDNENISKYVDYQFIDRLACMEYNYRNIKEFIKISKDNNLNNNYQNLENAINGMSIVIKSNSYPATLVYYARKYFSDIYLITNKENINHDFNDVGFKLIDYETDITDYEKRILVLKSERPIYSDEFNDIFMTFINSTDKIARYNG